MYYECVSDDAWDKIKANVEQRLEWCPIIGVCYMVDNVLNKAKLKSLIEKVKAVVKPMHTEIICAPCYDKNWLSEVSDQDKAKYKVAVKACYEVAVDFHINYALTCQPSLDHIYGGKNKSYFVREMVSTLKRFLPKVQAVKVHTLVDGTGCNSI